MKTKHTPEPWIFQSGKIISHDEHGDPYVVSMDAELMQRTVIEHNALAGIDDVEGFMWTMKDALEKADARLDISTVASTFVKDALTLFPKEPK